MNESLEKLKDIGAQKIYEETHIPVEHVQEILYESFEGLNKLQFLGFVSIMEREYGYDLSDLRVKGSAYFDEINKDKEVKINEAIYKAPTSKKNFMILYIVLAIIIFIVAIVYTMNSAQNTLDSAIEDNTIVENVKQNIIADINESEKNTTDENSTRVSEINSSNELDSNISTQVLKEVKQEAQVTHTFVIEPVKRVWLGYIDVVTNKKYQKTFKGKLKLNPKKEWLLYFGHGYINIIIDGKKVKFTNRNTLRLHYKDGKIQKVSLEEFKRLNRGNKW